MVESSLRFASFLTVQERVPIPYCSTAEEHVYYVWERVLKRLPCKHFVMVAHSYGGVGTCHLLKLAGQAAQLAITHVIG